MTIFRKVLNYRPIGAGAIFNISNTLRLERLSIALQENIMRENMILNAQI